jgi:superfamily II DNA or RNA helicase
MNENIASKLLGPQQTHAKTLLDSIYFNGFAADFSDTGTGKTYSACAVAKQLNVPVVVVCPKVVIPTWKKILAMFGVSGPLVINYEKLCRGNTKWLTYSKVEHNDRKNWDSAGIHLHFPKNSLVILDEVHKCKGTNSLNGDFLVACKNFGYKILMMSATAATNPLEMKAFGFTANLHTGYNFIKFCQMSGAEFNKFGGMVIDMTSDKAQSGMRAIHQHLFNLQNCASRMTVSQFDGIFPDNRILAESFDMGSNTERINMVYEHMQSELDSLDRRTENYSGHIFAIIVEARRKAELLKVPSLVESVVDLYNEGLSPVVFLNFTDSIEALESRLIKSLSVKNGDVIGKIVGGQSDIKRQKDIDDFSSDLKRIMLVNLAAGGAGVNLHDLNGKHPRYSMLIPSFSAINLLQALGRIARQGGKTKCIQKIIFSSGTIEEQACEKVQAKLDNLSGLNDNDLISGIDLYR